MRPLAPSTFAETGTLPGKVTRFKAVEAQIVGSHSGDHFISRHGFESRTHVQWVLLGLTDGAVAVCSCSKGGMLMWLSSSMNRTTFVGPKLLVLIWGQCLSGLGPQIDEFQ